MKNSIIKITVLIIIALGGFTSCEDFLDADNKSKVTASEQFSKPENFETLVNQAYYELRGIFGSPAIFSSGTDLYAGVRSSGDPTLEGYALTSDNETVKSLYTDLYGVTNAANAVLYYADIAEDYSEKELRKEEARFIRAYAYFILSQQFGGVPVIEEYISSAETSYPRNTLEETYTFIIDELTALSNSALLPASDKTGRASKQAAKALLAKVYLAAGWDLGTTLSNAENGSYAVTSTDYFSKAAAAAKEIADAVPLTLSFEDKWSPFNEQNEELIFAIQWDRNSSLDVNTGGHSHQNTFGTYLGAVTLGMKYLRSDFNIMPKAFYLYEEGDERYQATFMTTIYNHGNDANWSKEGYWAYYNATAEQKAQMPIAFHYPAWYESDAAIDQYLADNADKFVRNDAKNVSQVIHTAEPIRWVLYNDAGEVSSDQEMDYMSALSKVGTIPPVKKFDDPQTDISAATGSGSYRDLVILHVSDIYLVAAEAYLMAGNEGEALNYLNKVRSRAKADELTAFSAYQRFDPEENTYVSVDQAIDVILDERARELLGEYNRWMDLRRTRQLVKYNVRWNPVVASSSAMVGGDGNIKWYRPIPANEIGLNTGITSEDQNPGYTADTAKE
ncbi:RagB/SusD family nutrient uptake outer membrane protein [Roseimarinus sediminis]|uniref:RagB/SusD family nutrient uptake outer membrane protein n=1 Tax=Roseimarinus sediminis TaxID=1610899 RepID=UPI003D1E69A8